MEFETTARVASPVGLRLGSFVCWFAAGFLMLFALVSFALGAPVVGSVLTSLAGWLLASWWPRRYVELSPRVVVAFGCLCFGAWWLLYPGVSAYCTIDRVNLAVSCDAVQTSGIVSGSARFDVVLRCSNGHQMSTAACVPTIPGATATTSIPLSRFGSFGACDRLESIAPTKMRALPASCHP